jgi:hypothetical protein
MIDVVPPLSEPLVELNSTAVPLGTGEPLSLTVAVMVTVESTGGAALDVVSVRLTPVGGVVPPPDGLPPPLLEGGAVGDSPLHAANRRRTAINTIHDFRSLIQFMCEPPSGNRVLVP